MARMIRNAENRKYSVTFSLPRYVLDWFDKMKLESPGFDKNKFIIEKIDEYMKSRGDLNEKEE